MDIIKELLPIRKLAEDLGVQFKKNKAICPFHEEKEASLNISDTKNLFHCFGCKKGGSVLDLYMHAKGVDVLEAARELSQMYNIPWKESPEQQRRWEEEHQRHLYLSAFLDYCQKQLKPEHIKHLQERGLTKEFIEVMRIGYEPRKKPRDTDAAVKLGLMSNDYYLPSGSIIIPFFRYGKLIYLVFYRPGESPKYLFPKGMEKPLLGDEIIPRAEEVYLTEGVFDYLSLLQEELPVLCSLGTSLKSEHMKVLARAKRVFVFFDNDATDDGSNAGREAAIEIARSLYPICRIADLPPEEDLNELLKSMDRETFRKKIIELRNQSIDLLDLEVKELDGVPEWEKAEKAKERIVPLLAELDRPSLLRAKEAFKGKLGLPDKAIEAAIKQQTGKKMEADLEELEKFGHTASFPGLVDIVEQDDELCFMVKREDKLEIVPEINLDGIIHYPPPRDYVFWFPPRAEKVLDYYTKDTDQKLFYDLVNYHRGISELPGDEYYMLMAWWVFHTYIHQKAEYSPFIWLYAVPEMGKSRTGKAAIYVAYRGIHVESLREAYLLRVIDHLNVTLFFDVIDLWGKAEKWGTEDILTNRFEKGTTVARVIHPEKGRFKDMVSYKVFGPTMVATNEPISQILETRAVQINMPLSKRKFNNDVRPIDGLDLKNRLTAFRARWLTKELPETEKPADGRLGDIMRPLLQICLAVSPGEISSFYLLVRELQRSRQIEKSNSDEARIVQVILSLKEDVEEGLLSIQEITKAYNETHNPKLNEPALGKKTSSLGFSKKRKADKTYLVWDEKTLDTLAERYFPEPSENLHYLHNQHESSENGYLDHEGSHVGSEVYPSRSLHPANLDEQGDNVGCEGSEGSPESPEEEIEIKQGVI